jgi:NADH-quinone oxidoreductase subunit L
MGMHHDQDIRNMGGLRNYMKITYITSLIGSLALIGTPFFAGFYSKDSIIDAAHASHLPGASFAIFSVTAGVFVTAFYSFRMFFLVFHGPERFRNKPFPADAEEPAPALEDDGHGHGDHAHAHDAHGHDHAHDAQGAHGHDDHGHGHGDPTPHESPWVITLPLVLLAIPSAVIGAIAIKPLLYGSFFGNAIFFDTEKHPAMEELAKEFNEHGGALGMGLHAFFALPFLLALAGVVVSYVMYIVKPSLSDTAAKIFAPFIKVLENKYYFDWFNENVLAAGARLLGRGLWKGGDQGLIDGLFVNGSARLVGLFGGVVRQLQTGHLYWYALVMILGVFGLLTWQLGPYLSNVVLSGAH